MAHIYRLGVFLLASWFCSFASADFPPVVSDGYYWAQGQNPAQAKQATEEAACVWVIGHFNVINAPWVYERDGASSNPCRFRMKISDINDPGSINIFYQAGEKQCPANSGLVSANACRCQSGFSELGGQCVDPAKVKCDDVKGASDFYEGATFDPYNIKSYCPNSGAAAGCGAKVVGAFGGKKDGNSAIKWTIEVDYTGDTCVPPPVGPPSGGGETDSNGVPTKCKGSVGKVNGIDVCVPFDPAKNTVVTNGTTTNTGTPATDGKPAVPGSTSTSQSTCIGSKCTTTTTTTTGGTGPNGTGPGSTSKTETVEQPKDDFCKANPRSSACITSKFGAGDCKTPPPCDGDAIQCGIAALQLKTACALSPDDGGKAQGDFDLAKAVLPGDVVKGLPGNATLSIGPGSFDQTELLSGSCIADRTVTILSKPFVVPFSGVCPHLELLGQALVSIALLAAAFIVFRG